MERISQKQLEQVREICAQIAAEIHAKSDGVRVRSAQDLRDATF
jgi:hypothetical protein